VEVLTARVGTDPWLGLRIQLGGIYGFTMVKHHVSTWFQHVLPGFAMFTPFG
jgi:hypothetical protein